MKKKFSISKKIQGLQEMKEMGFNVPNFDFILSSLCYPQQHLISQKRKRKFKINLQEYYF